MKEIPILYTKKEDCCGCGACLAICNKQAITMRVDPEGFSYPEIDRTKCVKCHMCFKVCPIKKAL